MPQEFREEFLNTVQAEAQATGEGSAACFTRNMGHQLVEAEILPEFHLSYCVSPAGVRSKYRVDAYVFDDFDYTLNLVITDFSKETARVLGKVEITRLFSQLSRFIDHIFKGNLHETIEISTPAADLVDLIRTKKGSIRKYRLFLFTTADISRNIKEFKANDVDSIETDYQIWDIERIYKMCMSSTGKEDVNINFLNHTKKGLPILDASSLAIGKYKSYLSIIPGEVLADIYDRYGSQVLEGNVRSFLSTKVAVNKEIRRTILQEPEMFFAYNNGIAVTAKNITIDTIENNKYIVAAHDFQIINGGQTTASLSTTRHKDRVNLKNIYVQMKLTSIDEEDIESSTAVMRNISKSSNRQNKVSEVDFFSTHPFHIEIEKMSQRILANPEDGAQYGTKWFYERARGQFLQKQMRLTKAKKKQFLLENPKKKLVTKADLAKVRNTWAELPHIVSKGAQASFLCFAESIEKDWQDNNSCFNDKYYKESIALMILFRRLEYEIPKQEWYENGYRANLITYSMAFLHYVIKKQFPKQELDLMAIWTKQQPADILVQTVLVIAQKVLISITDENNPIRNVTQWCKQLRCWEKIKELDVVFPENFSKLLISSEENLQASKEAAKEQLISSDLDAQAKILERTELEWKRLYDFITQKKILSPKELQVLGYACQFSKTLPSPHQSRLILKLLDRAMAEGFQF